MRHILLKLKVIIPSKTNVLPFMTINSTTMVVDMFWNYNNKTYFTNIYTDSSSCWSSSRTQKWVFFYYKKLRSSSIYKTLRLSSIYKILRLPPYTKWDHLTLEKILRRSSIYKWNKVVFHLNLTEPNIQIWNLVRNRLLRSE